MSLGMFITFEGGEGCGKTTQIKRLSERLRRAGRNTFLIREPGGTFVGEEIRKLVQFSPEAAQICPETELLLFAASRAQLVNQIIIPALKQGSVVLCDRYVDSTTVYQGIARGLPLDQLSAVNRFATAGHMPDLTILFELDLESAKRRLNRRGGKDGGKDGGGEPGREDRIEKLPLEFHEKVRQGYLDIAKQEPGRFVIIDASGAADDIERRVWGILQERFHGLSGG